jgi:superfamily I DNA/RNA helicase
LLCFNRLLGRHMREVTKPLTSLEAGSLHRLLLRVSGLTPPGNPKPEFWDEVLLTATDRLLEENFARDSLIVDEMQDLAQPEYLDVLDLLVTGGLAGGRCLLFGDFERQALYGLDDGRDMLRARLPGLPSHSLVANCRNRPRIGAAVELLAAMSPGYKRYPREDDGVQPRYYWYETAAEQEARVIQAVRDLESEGYGLDEIVMLSPQREGALAAHATDPWLKRVLTPADGVTSRRGRLKYTTIHAFKGLEAAAAVLTDIDDAAAPQFDALLYVGLTRATDRLSLVATRAALRQKLGL